MRSSASGGAAAAAIDRRRQRGHLMIALVVMIAVMGIVSTKVARSWVDIQQREDEAEMIFRAEEIVRAIVKYRRDQGQRPLTDLEILMEPGTRGQYFLRRLYEDPLVTNGKWGLLYQGPNNSVIDPNAPDLGTLQPGDTRPLTPPTGPGTGFGDGTREIGGLPIIGVKTLCKKRPFRVYKNLQDYGEWKFTIYDFLTQPQTRAPGQQGGRQGVQGSPGGSQPQNRPRAPGR